ncbi:hypothetical protein DFP83_10574 [Idiomarina fontislapidosi]|uniref:DUF3806 domain-containing protein n=1 Tax=Idiomarina fontislapidosi TaxID=263723 RepID=A0A432XYH3_9GAMM|nr:hypothetical protein [Idiomarina fontislapidosi]PYE32767.1 hypothetical protein DFP83_10574 [Idiomarina fontislapidosi]RUO53792.1 hypothetical protein CWE25_07840 [Idiomarina fontislapidosi]
MQNKQYEEMMKALSQDAVKFARVEFERELDFSIESLPVIDAIVDSVKQKFASQLTDDKVVFTLSNMLGAYCGEVYIQHIGGNWLIEEADTDKNLVYVQDGDKTFPFPGIVYLNLVSDDKKSISEYFSLAVDK